MSSDRQPPTARYDRLVELTDKECHLRLQGHRLGRLAVSIDGELAVLPVHYAMLDDDPVFRTDAGGKLTAAANGEDVCLEIDDADVLNHTGWSVMVTGPSEVLTDPADLSRAKSLPLEPWVGSGDAFVRIRASKVTGREITSRR